MECEHWNPAWVPVMCDHIPIYLFTSLDFITGSGTVNNQCVAKQLCRLICEEGKKTVVVHIYYSSAFDNLSHIYLFFALKRVEAIAETSQLYKCTQWDKSFRWDEWWGYRIIFSWEGCLWKVKSLHPFILMWAWRVTTDKSTKQLNSSIARLNGIRVKDTTVDKLDYVDDMILHINRLIMSK